MVAIAHPLIVADGPLCFIVQPRRLQRVLPHLAAGLVWAGRGFVADEALQRAMRARTDGLRVDLRVQDAPDPRAVGFDITRSRGTVSIVIVINSYYRAPADRVLDGVAFVVDAYKQAAMKKKLPTSVAFDNLVERAIAEGLDKDLPVPRTWVGRVVHFRQPASEADPAWKRDFLATIEQVSGEVAIQYDGSGKYDPSGDEHVSSYQLYTSGPEAAVVDLIGATARASGAPRQYEVLEEDWVAWPKDWPQPHADDAPQAPGRPSASEMLVEVHVPIRDGELAWIDDIEDSLAAIDGGAHVYDDGEEWRNADGEPEYLFFLHQADEATLLGIAADVARRPGVPPGAYAVINTTDGDMGNGRAVDLTT